MISENRLRKIHAACTIIENNGALGIQEAGRLVGATIADALLVMYLRQLNGSDKRVAPDGIILKTNEMLALAGLGPIRSSH